MDNSILRVLFEEDPNPVLPPPLVAESMGAYQWIQDAIFQYGFGSDTMEIEKGRTDSGKAKKSGKETDAHNDKLLQEAFLLVQKGAEACSNFKTRAQEMCKTVQQIDNLEAQLIIDRKETQQMQMEYDAIKVDEEAIATFKYTHEQLKYLKEQHSELPALFEAIQEKSESLINVVEISIQKTIKEAEKLPEKERKDLGVDND